MTLQRLYIRSGYVSSVMTKSAEQQANMTRFYGYSFVRPFSFRDGPTTLVHQPGNKSRDVSWLRLIDLPVDDRAEISVGLRNGQSDDRRLTINISLVWQQGNVTGLRQ